MFSRSYEASFSFWFTVFPFFKRLIISFLEQQEFFKAGHLFKTN